jgi:hypothetical protein
MHVTLIHTPFTYADKSAITPTQCVGMLYVASYIRSHGHQVSVIDAVTEGKEIQTLVLEDIVRVGLSNQQIVSRIPKETEVIGVSVPFSHLAVH